MPSPSQVWRNHKKLHHYLNKRGKLLLWTKVLVPPQGFEDYVPYFSGIVEFKGGERMPLQIVDCKEEDLRENMLVVTVIRRGQKVQTDEVIEYVVKAKPAQNL